MFNSQSGGDWGVKGGDRGGQKEFLQFTQTRTTEKSIIRNIDEGRSRLKLLDVFVRLSSNE